VSAATGRAYTHAGSDVVAVGLASRREAARWPSGCRGTHGFPRVDERNRRLMASCNHDGEVVLLDLRDGRQLGRYAIGGDEALPALSAPGHLQVRADRGARLATLAASRRKGLRVIDTVAVPEAGHCLTGDGDGQFWTCDADGGRILEFADR